jgi:hypothetical protein
MKSVVQEKLVNCYDLAKCGLLVSLFAPRKCEKRYFRGAKGDIHFPHDAWQSAASGRRIVAAVLG